MTGDGHTGDFFLWGDLVEQLSQGRCISKNTRGGLDSTDRSRLFINSGVDLAPRDVVRHGAEDHGACDACSHRACVTAIRLRRLRLGPSAIDQKGKALCAALWDRHCQRVLRRLKVLKSGSDHSNPDSAKGFL